MYFDLEHAPDFKRTLFNAIVAPRPIGWISTLSAQGVANLAPFSHFNLVSTAPPVVIFSCNTPVDRAQKDTVQNVRATQEFVVNLVSRELLEAMNATSAPAPYGVDEFELAGITRAAAQRVRPPRVAQAPAHLECRLMQIVEIAPERAGDTASQVVFGRIVGVHLRDALLDARGRFDTVGAALMSRMGGLQYAAIGEVIELPQAHVRAGGGHDGC